jgi:hypothetical protein
MKPRFAILLIFGLPACVLISKQQSIDTDVNHRTHYAISEGTTTATLKIPPGYRTFKTSLPEPYTDVAIVSYWRPSMTTARWAPMTWRNL